MNIVKVKLSTLVPDKKNARRHSQQNIQAIIDSLKLNPQYRPFVVQRSTNKIVVGNGMYAAMKALGVEEGDVEFRDLSDEEATQLALTDNRTSDLSEWDNDNLLAGLLALDGRPLPGWTQQERDDLKRLLMGVKEPHEDNFDVDAELQKPVFSQLGDIWHLGRHRVICGDSTLAETYARLMGEDKANLVLTDPPFGIAVNNASGSIKNDNLGDKDTYELLLKAFQRYHEAMADDASIYVFYASTKSRIFYDAYEDAGFKVASGLVWKKDSFTLSRTDWKQIFEPIIYGWKQKGKHQWYGDQKQPTCFEFARIKSSKKEGFGHPTSKPVPMLAYLLQQSTQTNGIVIDGFLGSASTLIACDQLDRVCYGVELDPKFVDVAVMRFKNQAGKGGDENVFVIRNGEKLTYDQVMALMPQETAPAK